MSDRSPVPMSSSSAIRWWQRGLMLMLGISAIATLYAASLYSYLLFHTLVELFSVTTSAAVFMLVWNARSRIENQYLLFVGLSAIFTAALDLVHTLAYSGMPIFTGYDANLPTQLWIGARYLQSLSLLVALLFVRRRVPVNRVMLLFSALAGLILVSAFARVFPDCYVAGRGLTEFKISSEYIIVVMLLVATLGLWRVRGLLDGELVRLFMLANVFTIGAELAFTSYLSVYGPANFIGHILKLLAVGLWYRAIIRNGIMRPLEVLHGALHTSETRFRSYFELPLAGRAISSPDKGWLDVNDTLCDMLGYTKTELMQMTWAQLTHPADVALDLRLFDQVMSGEIDGYTLEKRFVHKNGQIVFTDLAVQCLRRPDRSVDCFVALIQNITERKQAEAALHATQTRLSQLLQTTDQGIYGLDPTGRCTFINQSGLQMLGYALSDCLGQNMHTLIHHSRADGSPYPQADCPIFKALHAGTDCRLESEVLWRKDGTAFPAAYSAQPIRDHDQIHGAVVTFSDITARKQAEEALRQSEARWQSIIKTSPDGICLAALNGTIQYVSDKLLTLHGYTRPEEMAGRDIIEFVHESSHADAQRRLNQMLTGQYPGVAEYQVLKRDGTSFYAEVNAEVLRDANGQPANILLVERDVTARKQTAEALRESERRFREMMDQVQLCCAILDNQANITFANDYFLKLTGWRRDEVMGRNWFDLFTPAHAAVRQDLYRDLAAGTVPLHYENEILTRHGVRRLVAWSNSVVHDAAGDIAGIAGIGVDITERKQAEAALLRQNQYLAALQETTLELSAQLDLDQLFENIVTRAATLVDAAGGFCDMVDLTTNQLLPRVGVGVLTQSRNVIVQPGEGVAGIVWQTGQPLVIQEYDAWANRVSKYDRGKLGAIIGVPLLKNQQTLGVLGLAYEFNSGRTFGQDAIEILMQLARLAAIAIDNARLFEAERARHRELEAVYEASLQVTRLLDVISVLDTISLVTLELTPADYVHIFLYDGEHFDSASAMSRQGRIAPLSWPRQAGLTYTAAHTGETFFIEDALRHPTYNAVTRQTPPQYAIAALPLMSEATVVGVMNVTYGCVHHFTDEEQRALKLLAAQVASAIKNARLHQQVRDHAQQLEQRVAERTADLQAANARLTELDRLKDEFLSRISHELRTPLTSVKIYVELLETARPDKRDKYIQTLKREADRLHQLIEEVLLFSQLNLNTEPLSPGPIDVNDWIESRLTTWARISSEHSTLQFRLALAADRPRAKVDGELFIQALTRLIANAVNYTPAGSVTVSTGQYRDNGRSWVTVSVADTGPGITPEDLPHIFERFYRGRAAADYKTPGTGIGLAISREIAEKLGGRLTVETQLGAGSTFTLWLPVNS